MQCIDDMRKVLRRRKATRKTGVSCKYVPPVGGAGDLATPVLVSLQVSFRLRTRASREKKADKSIEGGLLPPSPGFPWNEGCRRAAAGLNRRRVAGGRTLSLFVLEIVHSFYLHFLCIFPRKYLLRLLISFTVAFNFVEDVCDS